MSNPKTKNFIVEKWNYNDEPLSLELETETEYYYIAMDGTQYPKTTYIAFSNKKEAYVYIIYLYRLQLKKVWDSIFHLVEKIKLV